MGKPHRWPSQETLVRLAFNTRTQRKAKGYTLERLAEITGLSVSYGEIQAGRINVGLANLECLARGLDCTEADLLRPLPSDGVVVADLAQRCFTTLMRRSQSNGQEIEAKAQVSRSLRSLGMNRADALLKCVLRSLQQRSSPIANGVTVFLYDEITVLKKAAKAYSKVYKQIDRCALDAA
jgi:transcriptional regulator with XRE-family HTH domain